MRSGFRARLGVLVVGSALLVAALAGGSVTAFAQDGADVTTPTPSGGVVDPYDCSDFDSREEVLAVFGLEDASELDGDDDGIPCESIGEHPESSGTQSPTDTPVATGTPTETRTPVSTPTGRSTATPTSGAGDGHGDAPDCPEDS